jgi:hypothetical protein
MLVIGTKCLPVPLLYFRTMATRLEISAPHLADYTILEYHFEWLCDGSIKKLVEANLARELRYLEMYLLNINTEAITDIIRTYAKDGDQQVYESGATYRWVGVLRAAEKLWKTTDEYALFRTELEGINGASPQLVFKTQDR